MWSVPVSVGDGYRLFLLEVASGSVTFRATPDPEAAGKFLHTIGETHLERTLALFSPVCASSLDMMVGHVGWNGPVWGTQQNSTTVVSSMAAIDLHSHFYRARQGSRGFQGCRVPRDCLGSKVTRWKSSIMVHAPFQITPGWFGLERMVTDDTMNDL